MDWIYDIFEFSKKYPLDFTQMKFLDLFVIVYAGFALTYKRLFIRNLFLFLVSCFFYYKTSGLFCDVTAIQHRNRLLFWSPN